ncbi:unnamed protein product [Polarella glacialis]|uniref:Uncharacterized protein n=1 Tax=Polarella glacialis TaxID=89957 RepID=A0A813K937_POLGL|nr:unnamed protein product [Polarella glacialis]
MSIFEHFCGLSAVPAHAVSSGWVYNLVLTESSTPSSGVSTSVNLAPAPDGEQSRDPQDSTARLRSSAPSTERSRDFRDSSTEREDLGSDSSSSVTPGEDPIVGECAIIASELQGSMRDGTPLLSEYLRKLLRDRCRPTSAPSVSPLSGTKVRAPAAPPRTDVRAPAAPIRPQIPQPSPETLPSGNVGSNGSEWPKKPAEAKEGPEPTAFPGGSVFGSGLVAGLLRSLAAATIAFALEMCADFCVHLRVAARAVWWMLVAITALVAASFGRALWCCFLKPIARLTWRSLRYLTGKASPPKPLATGKAANDILWHGPRAQEPWSTDYMRLGVKARGDQRLPHDLLIAHLLPGFDMTLPEDELIGTGTLWNTTRWLADRAKTIEICCARMTARFISALLILALLQNAAKFTLLSAKRLAHGNVLSRCFYLTRILTWAGSTVCTDQYSVIRLFSLGGMALCEADLTAMSVSGEALPLSPELCRERAPSSLTPLLSEDSCLSDTRAMHSECDFYYFPACAAHQAMYESYASKRRCAWASPEATPRTSVSSSLKETSKPTRTPPHSAPSSRSSTPTGRREASAPLGTKAVCLGFGDASCLRHPDVTVWIRRRGRQQGREEAYYSFPGLFTGKAGDSTVTDVFLGISVPDLGLYFSVPESITLPDNSTAEVNRLLDLRAPAIVNPTWVVKGLARNRESEPLPIVEISDLANCGPDGFECNRSAQRDPNGPPPAIPDEGDTSEPPTPRLAQVHATPLQVDSEILVLYLSCVGPMGHVEAVRLAGEPTFGPRESKTILQRSASAFVRRKAEQGVAVPSHVKMLLRTLLGPSSETESQDYPPWSALDAMCTDSESYNRHQPSFYPARDVPEPMVRTLNRCSFCHMDPPHHLGRDCPYHSKHYQGCSYRTSTSRHERSTFYSSTGRFPSVRVLWDDHSLSWHDS